MVPVNEKVSGAVSGALRQLLAAATTVDSGWVPQRWSSTQVTGGPAPSAQRAGSTTRVTSLRLTTEEVHFRQAGVFDRLRVAPGQGVDLTTRLDLPAVVHGVAVTGEPLELVLNSLRPVDVLRDGARVFGDRLPVVASGPALIELVPHLVAGDNGELCLAVLPAPVPLDGQGHLGLVLRFTTPSLRARFATLDLAHARLLLAAELAADDEERAALERAAALVPASLSDLSNEQLTEVLGGPAADGGMAAELMWLEDRLAGHRLHCVGHSHIDLAWLHTLDDTREVIARDLSSVLALFEDFPEFRFTHSQAAGYAEFQRDHPRLFGEVRQRIAEGRLEPATMQWVESDANLLSGPSHARQLAEAVDYSVTELGRRPRVLLAPDTFGHAGNLPQLATGAGARIYYQHRANPGFPAEGHHWQAFWWQGDDGSRLLSVATPVYLGPVTATLLATDLIRLGRANRLTQVCYFYGVGDHGGGPTRQDLEAIRALGAARCFPAVVCATLSDYVDALLATHPSLPTATGETETVFEGCYITHADSKRLNRDGEAALLTAEALAALAGLHVESELSAAWRAVLLHQFHDILGGSAVAQAFADQRRDVAGAIAAADAIRDEALTVLRAGRPAGTVAVTNPVGAARRDVVVVPAEVFADLGDVVVVTDADDEVVPTATAPAQRTADGGLVFVADVEAFGTAGYRLRAGGPGGAGRAAGRAEPAAGSSTPITVDQDDDELVINTPFFLATVRRGAGILTALHDKVRRLDVVGRGVLSPESRRQHRPELGLGAVQVYRELPHGMSSWVSDEYADERTLLSGAVTEAVELGPVRVVVEARHVFDRSTATLRYTLYADLPWIDVELDVEWGEVGSPETGIPGLALCFGTRQPVTTLWTEAPFATVARVPDGYLVPTLRWAELAGPAGGLAVANDSKHGVDALGPRLRYHVVRGAYDPDPVSDAGRRDVSRYRVLPHAGGWVEAGVVAAAAGLNQPLLADVVPAEGGPAERAAPAALDPAGPPSLPSRWPGFRPALTDPDSAVVAGLQPLGEAVLVRLWESAGRSVETTLTGVGAGAHVWACTLLGERIAEQAPVQVPGPAGLSDPVFPLAFSPFQVRTVLVTW